MLKIKRMEARLARPRFLAVLVLTFLLCTSGCTYTFMTRYYAQREEYRYAKEWKVFTQVSAMLLSLDTDQDDFIKRFGHPPEEHYCYSLWVWLQLPTTSDSSIFMNKNDIKIDSLIVDFSGYSNSFSVDNSYEENDQIRHNRPFDRTKIIEVDSLCIPPGIKEINTTIFGQIRDSEANYELFQISEILTYQEITKKIGKYD